MRSELARDGTRIIWCSGYYYCKISSSNILALHGTINGQDESLFSLLFYFFPCMCYQSVLFSERAVKSWRYFCESSTVSNSSMKITKIYHYVTYTLKNIYREPLNLIYIYKCYSTPNYYTEQNSVSAFQYCSLFRGTKCSVG
jgi:hypothetical protein